MGTKYVISEPSPPSWWAQNKAVAYAVVGLAVGLYFGGGCDDQKTTEPTPPTSTTSPSPSVSGSPR